MPQQLPLHGHLSRSNTLRTHTHAHTHAHAHAHTRTRTHTHTHIDLTTPLPCCTVVFVIALPSPSFCLLFYSIALSALNAKLEAFIYLKLHQQAFGYICWMSLSISWLDTWPPASNRSWYNYSVAQVTGRISSCLHTQHTGTHVHTHTHIHTHIHTHTYTHIHTHTYIHTYMHMRAVLMTWCDLANQHVRSQTYLSWTRFSRTPLPPCLYTPLVPSVR